MIEIIVFGRQRLNSLYQKGELRDPGGSSLGNLYTCYFGIHLGFD